ncbi:DMT family transporter [Peribacillus acanthi]|uniref:DMT family transporter n=1 Tax=Peribacillus acanthi TaxID=2171554 RepID=UPI000D3ED271|nr:DMT family transporter [Peribacillus acanthi]
MNAFKAELLLVLVAIFWGSSYLFMEMGLQSISEFNLIALRFGLAFLLAASLFLKRLCHIDFMTLKFGMILGLILFLIFTAITFGLKTTTTSNAGFLVSLTVVFVPIISSVVLKKKMEHKLISSIILALIGISFLTIKLPLHIMPGDLFCIIAAFLYALHILIVSFVAQKIDTLNLGIIQLGFAGIFGLIFSLFIETPTFPTSTKGWVSILALSIFCSALGFIIQIVAQQYTSATKTGLIFSLEPVFAAIFGFIFLDENMSTIGVLGAILVLLSIILTNTINKNEKLSSSMEKNAS